MELVSGQAVGPYRLMQPAGAGGMAEVWRATDVRLDRQVAIKFLSPRYASAPGYIERFRHEARAISRLDHPNILAIFDFGEQDGWTYMVSPFIGGGTLAARLSRSPWTLAETIAVLGPLASALDFAHRQGVIHRDVKPSNVLFTEHERLVLSDFGIARMLESSTVMSQVGQIVGTPLYMSPEQADGQRVGPASDRYSLGIVAYQMLTGRPPFLADTPLALLRAHLDKPLPPPRHLNPHLSDIVEAALFKITAKDPRERFPSATEFVAALSADISTRLSISQPIRRQPAQPPRTQQTPPPAPPLSGVARPGASRPAARTSQRLSRREMIVGLGAVAATSGVVGVLGWAPARPDAGPATPPAVVPATPPTLVAVATSSAPPVPTPTVPTPTPTPFARREPTATAPIPTQQPAAPTATVPVAPSPTQPTAPTNPSIITAANADRLNLAQRLPGPVYGTVFSPDSQTLAMTHNKFRSVAIWNCADGSLVREIRSDAESLGTLAFSPDGQLVAAAERSRGTVWIWRVADGELLAEPGTLGRAPDDLLFAPDGQTLLVSARDRVEKWAVADQSPAKTPPWDKAEGVRELQLILGGSRVFASGNQLGATRIWDAETGRLLRTRLTGREYTWDAPVTASQDGSMLAMAPGLDDPIELLRVDGPDNVFRSLPRPGEGGYVTSLAFSPDGQMLAASQRHGQVRLYSVADGRLLRTILGHTDRAFTVAFSPDGETLAVGSSGDDQRPGPGIRLWRVTSA